MRRMAIWPWCTTGRSAALLMPRMPTSGWLMIGVAARPPMRPRLVIVNVESDQLVARDRMVAGRLGDAAHLAGRLPQVHRLGMPHDRHAQAAIGLRRHAQVHGLEPRDHFALDVVMRVELRKPAQRPRHRQHDERQIRELRLAVGATAVEVFAQRFELGDVDFFDVREVGNLRVADDHLLGDAPPHADHLDFGRVRAIRPPRRRRATTSLRRCTSTSRVRDPAVRARAVNVLQIDVQLAGPPPHGRAGLRLSRCGDSSLGRTARCTNGGGRPGRHRQRQTRRRCSQSNSPRLLVSLSPCLPALRRRIKAHQLRTHRHRFAHVAVRSHHASHQAARNRDRRLVGHHIDQRLIDANLLRPAARARRRSRLRRRLRPGPAV